MLTRRDALTQAAVVAAAALPPFAVSPEQAAELLAQPLTVTTNRGRLSPAPADPLDPASFAEQVDIAAWLDTFESGAAVEMAAYHQAFNLVLDHFGITGPELRGLDNPLTDLDDAARSLWCVAWMAGVRAGAACEHLRLAMVTPRQSCPGCYGNGKTWGGTPFRLNNDGTNEAVCPECAGLGHIATPAATLPFGS